MMELTKEEADAIISSGSDVMAERYQFFGFYIKFTLITYNHDS